MKNPWKKLGQRYVFERKTTLKIREDLVIQPDGARSKYAVVERPDTSLIVPVTNKGELCLVRQWRYPAEKESLELPMGMINEGELPKTAAVRELREEIGMEPGKGAPELIGEFYPAPGLAKQKVFIFLADNLKKPQGQYEPDPTERIEVERYSLEEVEQKIKDGGIDEAFTITSLWYYKLWLEAAKERH